MSGNFGEELGGSPVDSGGGGSDSDTDTDTDSEDTGGPPEDDGFDPDPEPSPSVGGSSGGIGGGVVDQAEPEPEPEPSPSVGGSSGGLGGGVVDQPDPDPAPSPEDVQTDSSPEPDPEPSPSVGGSSGGIGGGVVDQPESDPAPSPEDVQEQQQPDPAPSPPPSTNTGTVDFDPNPPSTNTGTVDTSPAGGESADAETAPGGSLPDAPETVGGGFAPPEEAAAAEGSPLAGTDEAFGESVDTAVETVEDSPVADAGSAIATGSRNVVGFANRNVVSPVAGFVGERVDVGQQLLGTGGRFDADTGEVETQTGPDIGNPFDLQAETETGQATAGIVEAGGRGATGATLGAPAGVVSTVNIAGQAAEFTGEAVADEGLQQGVAESGDAALSTGQTAANRFRTAATERPLQTGAAVVGGLAGGLAGGTAVFRGAAGAASRARSARVRQQADEIVDFEDISDRSVVGQTDASGNPEFSPAAVDDTDIAVAEFRDQASDAPDALQEMAGGEEVVFNVNEQGGLPETGTVQAGPRSEVSGLFTAADASDLRLREGGDSGGGLFGVPSLSDFRDQRRIAATNPEDIRGVPDELGGSRTPGEDLDRPTRDDSGEITGREQGDVSEFITQEGTEGEAFVLPRGTRTSEQEAIIPEGTSFRRTGDSVAVNFEGDTIPLNVFEFGDARRGDVDVDTPPRAGGFDGETTSRVTRRGDPGASGRTVGTVTPSGGAGSGSAGAGGGSSTGETTTPGGDSPPIFDTPSGGSSAGGPDNGDSGGPFGGDGDSPGGGGSGGGGPGGSPPFITDGSSTTGGSPPPDEPTGGGFSFGFGIPSRPGQPPRRPRLDSDTEPDEQESETTVFATSDTFASGILSAEDVLDS